MNRICTLLIPDLMPAVCTTSPVHCLYTQQLQSASGGRDSLVVVSVTGVQGEREWRQNTSPQVKQDTPVR